MMNDVKLLGRLADEPELRYTTNGTAVTSFSLAVGIPSKGQEKKADFFTIVAWRDRAEFVCKHLSKGRQVVVCGRLATKKWKDKHDQNRKDVEIVANAIYFADGARQDTAPSGQHSDNDVPLGFEEIEDDGTLPF